METQIKNKTGLEKIIETLNEGIQLQESKINNKHVNAFHKSRARFLLANLLAIKFQALKLLSSEITN